MLLRELRAFAVAVVLAIFAGAVGSFVETQWERGRYDGL